MMGKVRLTVLLAVVVVLFACPRVGASGRTEPDGLRAATLNGRIDGNALAGTTLTRYIVLERRHDGAVRPLRHEIVRLAAPQVSLTAAEMTARLATVDRSVDRLTVQLVTSTGSVVHQNVVDVPRWLRGEFHGSDPEADIDSHIFPLERTAFVVRVPVIAGTRLHLRGGLAKVNSTFDLTALATDASLPLADSPAEAAQASGAPTGDPANRVDLLIMGDGYTAEESAKFAADAENVAANFFNLSPYAEYANYVNVRTLFTASAQSGADHPPYVAACSPGNAACCGDPLMQSDPLAGTFVNTAFDSAYCTWNIHRLLTVNSQKVLAAAAAVPDWDRILMIVNDATYGGSGGFTPVISMHATAVNIAQHEYGHSFTRLADEYDDPYPGFPACSDISGPACEPNVTDQANRPLIKWAPWISAETPVPTPEGDPQYSSVVGLFEGARYLPTGMYRSSDNCLMRSLGRPFCQVPSQAYVLRLYEGGWGVPTSGIDPIEPGLESPPPGDVVVDLPATITFRVALLQPSGGPPLQVEWYVNGELVPGEVSNSYTLVSSGPGDIQVRLQVKDVTSLVHPAAAATSLDSARVWNVKDRDADNDGVSNDAEGQCGDAIDDDGNGLINDGCPQIGATAESGDQCTNATDDDGDGWINDGCPGTETSACGSHALDPSRHPERIDPPFVGTDDDGDGDIDEALPPGSGPYDCDGDGFSGTLEQFLASAPDTRTDQNPCADTPTANDEDPDPWPPDADDDQDIDVGDSLALFYGKIADPPSYTRRSDFDADGDIDVGDLLAAMFGRMGTSCA